MKYLLDTNICIAYINGTSKIIKDNLLSLSPQDAVLCSVVKAELLYGARNSTNVEKNIEKLNILFESIASLPFDDDAAAQYGQIRSILKRGGKLIGANDMMIASICLAKDLILVTRNLREFNRIGGLRIVEW